MAESTAKKTIKKAEPSANPSEKLRTSTAQGKVKKPSVKKATAKSSAVVKKTMETKAKVTTAEAKVAASAPVTKTAVTPVVKRATPTLGHRPAKAQQTMQRQTSHLRPVARRQAGGYSRNFSGNVDGRSIPDAGTPTQMVTGALDIAKDGHGILRTKFSESDFDAYISNSQIRRFRLRPGDMISGPARKPKENERYWGLLKVDTVHGKPPAEMMNRPRFRNMTPIYPDAPMILETDTSIFSTRLIDLASPIGYGQRGLIVSPPKAGKTTIIKEMATGVAQNHPKAHLMAVLVGERPEEVTDIKRHIEKETGGKGEVAASNFDESPTDQCRVAETALERARRLVEMGEDVVILLDSITRLARAYNLAMPTSGRTLSGGFDPAALFPPKRFFGAARNFEEKGSLTIVGTALVDTGSRMDDLIYEEFKGTGNMELHLDRHLAERRIYPAIDVQRSGTRKEELLFDNDTYQSVLLMRRMIDLLGKNERTSLLLQKLKKTKNNKEFLASLRNG